MVVLREKYVFWWFGFNYPQTLFKLLYKHILIYIKVLLEIISYVNKKK